MNHAQVVLLSRQGAPSLLAEDRSALEQVADVRYHALQQPPGPTRAVELLSGATHLAATNAVLPQVDERLLSRLPRLRSLVLYATGHDHLDLELLRRREIELSVLPDYATQAVAEHALAMLMALASRLHLANDRSRGLAGEVSLRGVELGGRTLAVVGTGRIGRALARISRGIGMRVVGVDVDPSACARAFADGIGVHDLGAALAQADAVAVCASHSFGRGPVIGPTELHTLRPGAFLVNVGRPALVDTAAAAAALRTGRLRGYAVDDVVADPRRDEDLVRQGRLLQTGHSAWWRDEVLDRGRRMWGEALLAAVSGSARDVVTSRPAAAARAAGS